MGLKTPPSFSTRLLPDVFRLFKYIDTPVTDKINGQKPVTNQSALPLTLSTISSEENTASGATWLSERFIADDDWMAQE